MKVDPNAVLIPTRLILRQRQQQSGARVSTFETDDQPAFAPTLHSIFDRYRHAAIDRLNAVNALTGITLALAPEELFGDGAEDRLTSFFEQQLDLYSVADGEAKRIRDGVVAFVWSAAQGESHARGILDGHDKPRL